MGVNKTLSIRTKPLLLKISSLMILVAAGFIIMNLINGDYEIIKDNLAMILFFYLIHEIETIKLFVATLNTNQAELQTHVIKDILKVKGKDKEREDINDES